MQSIKEAIEDLRMLCAWDRSWRQVPASWPELAELIRCAKDLDGDERPYDVNDFTDALARLLDGFNRGI